MNIHKVEFVKSAASAAGLIANALPQIVFSGKSNVGKSSVINKTLNRKNLARSSSTPGKTIHVNYFLVDGAAYFVDLPGYGYATVAKSERERWGKLMDAFFADPVHIALGVMIVDARHQPTGNDLTMAECFKLSLCPLVVLANKIDKVKSSEKESNLSIIRETLGLDAGVRIIPFSARSGEGREELLSAIESAVAAADAGQQV